MHSVINEHLKHSFGLVELTFFLDICVVQGTVHNYYVGRIGTVFIIGANLLLKIHPFKKFESIPDLIFIYICSILVQLRKSTIK